jgi:hypothetical protein
MDGGNEQPVRVLDRRREERRVGLVFAMAINVELSTTIIRR